MRRGRADEPDEGPELTLELARDAGPVAEIDAAAQQIGVEANAQARMSARDLGRVPGAGGEDLEARAGHDAALVSLQDAGVDARRAAKSSALTITCRSRGSVGPPSDGAPAERSVAMAVAGVIAAAT